MLPTVIQFAEFGGPDQTYRSVGTGGTDVFRYTEASPPINCYEQRIPLKSIRSHFYIFLLPLSMVTASRYPRVAHFTYCHLDRLGASRHQCADGWTSSDPGQFILSPFLGHRRIPTLGHKRNTRQMTSARMATFVGITGPLKTFYLPGYSLAM